MEEAVVSLLNTAPLVTAVLASIGIATVAYLFWSLVKPVLTFLASSWHVQLFFWIFSLGIAGAGFLGYGNAGFPGMYQGLGISGIIIAIATTAIFWIRKWVKWYHKESEEYK